MYRLPDGPTGEPQRRPDPAREHSPEPAWRESRTPCDALDGCGSVGLAGVGTSHARLGHHKR
ncbi:MAG: hypothetical protein ACKOFW_09965, partial [Planctomycetaceae bacterium]